MNSITELRKNEIMLSDNLSLFLNSYIIILLIKELLLKRMINLYKGSFI